jgi:hypothetical protein
MIPYKGSAARPVDLADRVFIARSIGIGQQPGQVFVWLRGIQNFSLLNICFWALHDFYSGQH